MIADFSQDTKELIWAIHTFQKCVPTQYRTPIHILIAKYYYNIPIKFFNDVLSTIDLDKYNTSEKLLDFIQQQIKKL